MMQLKETRKPLIETRGIVQIRGADGKLRNYKAYTLKRWYNRNGSGGFDQNR